MKEVEGHGSEHVWNTRAAVNQSFATVKESAGATSERRSAGFL